MFGSLGFTELILILFIVLIIFGAGKLPQLGKGSARRSRASRSPCMRRTRLKPKPKRPSSRWQPLRSKRFRNPRCKHRLPWNSQPRRFIQFHAASQPGLGPQAYGDRASARRPAISKPSQATARPGAPATENGRSSPGFHCPITPRSTRTRPGSTLPSPGRIVSGGSISGRHAS